MKQMKTSRLNPEQGQQENSFSKRVQNTVQTGLLGVLVAAAASLGAFAQTGPQGGNVRQNIDAASNFLGGLVGILFLVFIIRGFLKKKQQSPRNKNEK